MMYFRRSTSGPVLERSSEEREKQVKRLIYHAKQRGWLELDLLLGGWAERHVRTLSDAELDDLALVLAEETLDIWEWVTRQSTPPALLESNAVFRRIREYVMDQANGVPANVRATKGWGAARKGSSELWECTLSHV